MQIVDLKQMGFDREHLPQLRDRIAVAGIGFLLFGDEILGLVISDKEAGMMIRSIRLEGVVEPAAPPPEEGAK